MVFALLAVSILSALAARLIYRRIKILELAHEVINVTPRSDVENSSSRGETTGWFQQQIMQARAREDWKLDISIKGNRHYTPEWGEVQKALDLLTSRNQLERSELETGIYAYRRKTN